MSKVQCDIYAINRTLCNLYAVKTNGKIHNLEEMDKIMVAESVKFPGKNVRDGFFLHYEILTF